MCGFCGCIGKHDIVDYSYLKTINDTLNHRGPDSSGMFKDENFVLAFRRLSIIDLSEQGNQPMSSDDGRYKLVFNGEIYNYKSLIKFIDNKKNLKTKSDTEVLLRLLIQKKEEALYMLNGMFSFVFIDTLNNEFIMARDRLGIKPLFYSFFNNVLYFSSELPTLLKFNIPKKLNLVSLNRFIRFGQINSPDTIYDKVFKLDPGSCIIGNSKSLNKVIKKKWWQINVEEDYSLNQKIWIDKVDEILFDATKLRLISDVPTGIFLSGGIDSSLVAHYSSIQNEFEKPKAFTVKFDNEDYNEFNVAHKVAKSKNLELISLNIDYNSLDDINKFFMNVGEPFSDSSLLNQYNLANKSKNFATVFLSGDGGDEAFAGYSEYLFAFNNRRKLNFISSMLKFFPKRFFNFLNDDYNFKQQLSKLNLGSKYLGTSLRINHQEPLLKSLLKTENIISDKIILEPIYEIWNSTKKLNFIKRLQILDYKNYLEPDILVKVDRATMANSIECRSPFLDHRVIELAMNIPIKYNMSNGSGKNILRNLASRYLPNEITNLPKKGFALPYRSWLNNNKKLQLYDLIRSNGHNLWNEDTINLIIKNADSKRYDYYSVFWRIWSFEIWFKNSGLN